MCEILEAPSVAPATGREIHATDSRRLRDGADLFPRTKAAFVQFLSESYPDDVALNWLCYELTDTLEQKSVLNDEKLMIRYLKERSGIRPCK